MERPPRVSSKDTPWVLGLCVRTSSSSSSFLSWAVWEPLAAADAGSWLKVTTPVHCIAAASHTARQRNRQWCQPGWDTSKNKLTHTEVKRWAGASSEPANKSQQKEISPNHSHFLRVEGWAAPASLTSMWLLSGEGEQSAGSGSGRGCRRELK